jgi:hypothetical protein
MIWHITFARSDYQANVNLVAWRSSNGVWFERRSQLGDFASKFGASTDTIGLTDDTPTAHAFTK